MLCNKKLFLFDIDGTLAIEDTLYPGSAALLSYIESIQGAAFFITNNSTKSNEDYVKKFAEKFHLRTTPQQFITSGYMAIRFLKKYHADDKIFALATDSFIQELRKAGLTITTTDDADTDCALIAFDNELTYDKLQNICGLLTQKDIPFYATNPDLRCPVKNGYIPDCGSICQMVENCTEKKPLYLGKPNKEVVKLCQELSGFSEEETLVIGDRLYTDIACGIAAGVETAVVLTGEATKEDLKDTIYSPTYCFETIEELYRWVIDEN